MKAAGAVYVILQAVLAKLEGGRVISNVMLKNKIRKYLIIFWALTVCLLNIKYTLACTTTALVELVGIQNEFDLEFQSKPGDKYNITCRNEIVNSGVVDTNNMLHMKNGAIFKVEGLKRHEIIVRLMKMHITMNTNNSIHLMPGNNK